ncbi:unnamed protein product [Chondrus crispus]|uniref:Uncharacterized protein n=1 Tax=Chondrus crispus TaxID=2769 RepID=R7Q7H5_CHOCR|nr:unnamed protein product [Chondrus crispus]CDF33420.1 unnamed protein product [Chondrus crispus]|eukprot:XP_005713223.1 unnamed protein product [Chondrus crispus]
MIQAAFFDFCVFSELDRAHLSRLPAAIPLNKLLTVFQCLAPVSTCQKRLGSIEEAVSARIGVSRATRQSSAEESCTICQLWDISQT